MKLLISLFIFLVILTKPMFATDSCTEPQGIGIKVQDKIATVFDTFYPFLLQNPVKAILFHLSRSEQLYLASLAHAPTNPGESIRLLLRGQHHITLLEKEIRSTPRQSDVPFDTIFKSIQTIRSVQDELLGVLPRACTQPIKTTEQFMNQSEQIIQKLYYEQLLK